MTQPVTFKNISAPSISAMAWFLKQTQKYVTQRLDSNFEYHDINPNQFKKIQPLLNQHSIDLLYGVSQLNYFEYRDRLLVQFENASHTEKQALNPLPTSLEIISID